MLKLKLMEFLDAHLGYLGLCRNAHYIDMKRNYAQIISMTQRMNKRTMDKNLQLTIELAQVRQDLDNAQKLLQGRAYIKDVG